MCSCGDFIIKEMSIFLCRFFTKKGCAQKGHFFMTFWDNPSECRQTLTYVMAGAYKKKSGGELQEVLGMLVKPKAYYFVFARPFYM